MSNVTRLPPHPKTVHVEADIPVSQRDELERAIVDVIAGERPRMDTLDRYEVAITRRALAALKVIARHPLASYDRWRAPAREVPGLRVQRPGLSV